MKLYGLTGGIGMGKSTAERLLRERSLPVVDTDVIARELVEPDQPALGEIKKAFGDGVVSSDGCLRRDELARIVFADSSVRSRLEQILHPRIQDVWQKQIAEWRDEGKAQAVVVIPLLFETNAQLHFSAVICVACSAATQIKRLRARGWDQKQIEQRLSAQWPIQKKMDASNFVVWTEGAAESHAGQLQRIIA